MTHADDDHRLTPSQSLIVSRGTQLCINGLPFSVRDFPEFVPGTIRNSFSALRKKGLIERYDRSSLAFYWSAEVPKPATVMKSTRAVVDTRDLQDLVTRLKLGDRAVHDIRLRFSAPGAYNAVLRRATPTRNQASGDAALPSMARGLTTGRMIVHVTDTISVFIGCSLRPFPLTLEGFTNLAAFVGEVRGRVEGSLGRDVRIPEVSTWLITQWHYGRDGRNEITGPRFNLTLDQLGEVIYSMYIKDLPGRRTLRVERKESPRKPFCQALLEKFEAP